MKYFLKIIIFAFSFFLLGLCLDYIFSFNIFSNNIVEITLVVVFVILFEKLNKILEKLEKIEKYCEKNIYNYNQDIEKADGKREEIKTSKWGKYLIFTAERFFRILIL